MRTHDILDDQGRLYAFEVDNALLGRSGVAAVVRAIPGAVVLELHRSWWGPDEFCRFRVAGVEFRAWEPFGDNSRYWIGPEPPHVCPETAIVLGAFQAHHPVLRRPLVTGPALVIGGLVAGVLSRGALGAGALLTLACLMSVAGLFVTYLAISERLHDLGPR